MLIVCLAANLGIGGGTIVFEFLKVFFPKQVDFIVMTTTRRWGQLLGQPVQRSSKVVVPFLDTSSTIIVVGGTPGVQTPMPWPLSFPALTNSLRHCLVFLLCVSAHCDLALLVTLLPSHPALQEGSTSKTLPRKSQSSARKVSLTSQFSVTNLPVPASYHEDDDRDTEWRGVSGKIGDVDDKVEGLDQKIDDKIDALDQKMDTKIDAPDQKIDDKIGALDQKMDAKINALDQKMDSILHLLQK